MKKRTLFFLFIIPLEFNANAGERSSPNTWTSNPFEQKVFIENRGQFNEKTVVPEEAVLFGTACQGVDLYFSAGGLIYRYNQFISMTEKEKENFKRTGLAKEEEEERGLMKCVPHYLNMSWIGANPNVKVIAEDPVSFYFTYGLDLPEGVTSGQELNTTIKASAFKKIIYKNLYPNIDVEYIFPEGTSSEFGENKSGIKYTLIVHPGGDISKVKMRYTADNQKHDFIKSNAGNVIIKSDLGDFVDHAPITFYRDNMSELNSSFILSGNEISFNVGTYDNARTVVIDPWLTNPALPGYNAAYDVNYDLKGNVYAYGSYAPFRLAKFSSSGAPLWIFAATGLGVWNGGGSPGYIYGDFAVDEVTGTSYLVEGATDVGTGAKIFKVNTSGVKIKTFPGNPKIDEMWRVEYNRCINQIVIAGGGTQEVYQAGMLDTNLAGFTPLNVLSATEIVHDMTLLSIDPASNSCYMATTKSQVYPANFDNILYKFPLPGLSPPIFSVPDGYKFGEALSIHFGSNGNNINMIPNGMNGMTVSPNYLYTYDSDVLKRWNKNTGAFVASKKISAVAPKYGGLGEILVRWSGLSSDECDNIYVGVGKSINEYNTSLTLINTYALPDTVYDVKYGPNDKLYACGKSFVTEIDVTPNHMTVATTQTASASCSCNGSASANVSCGNPAGFVYSWSTSPVQTTQTVTGLCPGTYTVTVSTSCFLNTIGTVTVLGAGNPFSTTTNSVPASCLANDGTATVTVSGGTAPYTYNWSPVGGTDASATGLSTGTYSVTITDASGCSGTSTVAVSSSSAVTVTVTSTQSGCTVANGTATANPSNGVAPYTYLWSGGQTTSSLSNIPAGNYSVMISDANGCTKTETVTVSSSSGVIASASSTPTRCTVANGTATANPSGGAVPYSYLWNNGQTTSVAAALAAGSYTCTITDANGCSGMAVATVVQPSGINSSVTSYPDTCSQSVGSATATGIGGTVPYSYLWNNGQTTSVAVALSAGSYTCTVTDANGCANASTVTVTNTGIASVNAGPDITIITGSSTVLTASGGVNYSWSTGETTNSITVSPTITTIYIVTVTDAGGCSGVDTVVIMIAEPVTDCSEAESPDAFILPNAFSPNNDGQNEKFHLLHGQLLADCVKEFYIAIYNRWGEKIFEGATLDFIWDGTYKGKVEETAVFGYYLEAVLENDLRIKKKGNITLLR